MLALILAVLLLMVSLVITFWGAICNWRPWVPTKFNQHVMLLICLACTSEAYVKSGIFLRCMHYGIFKRVQSEVDLIKLQSWTEVQTTNFSKLDLDKLQPPVQQPRELTHGYPYRVRLGELQDGHCVCIEKNFGGGFWDYGVLIGPSNMKCPEYDPAAIRFHQWHDGVFTWL
jgi:hypothetical protein